MEKSHFTATTEYKKKDFLSGKREKKKDQMYDLLTPLT